MKTVQRAEPPGAAGFDGRQELRLGTNDSIRLDLTDRDLGPLAGSLLTYWRVNCPAGGLPDRRSFDPVLLGRWLGYLSLYEFEAERNDFRNRLEGSYVADLTGENWTGRRASEVDARFGTGFLAELHEVRSQWRPVAHLIKVFQKEYSVAERVLLPVAVEPGGPADQIFVAIFANGFRPTRSV